MKYIDKIHAKLREKYNEVYLIHNERFFRLYNFEDGKPFEPDSSGSRTTANGSTVDLFPNLIPE